MHTFKWPIIDHSSIEAVITQLKTDVSLYRKEGIYEEFENKYAAYHNVNHCLVLNSGTTSLWTLYGCLDLKPGDEILVPSYTFFATISPMIHWGLVPVFCDALPDGNFDPQEIRRKKTAKTKAVMVTHMWGIPCDLPTLREICDAEDLLLLEDCSHAHGADIGGRKVGSWGDLAAWSLQGKKIVSAGEGGVLATSHRHYYEKAIFLSHFNKRCIQEVSPDRSYHAYGLTGAGMNLRPSPLAIALANQQFDHLDTWIDQKSIFAHRFNEAIQKIPFLSPPSFLPTAKPAWYALTLQFHADKAPCTRQEYVDILHHQFQLGSVDIPMSTCPNHVLPLFARPQEVRPEFYTQALVHEECPQAQRFFHQAIKLFVPTQKSDEATFQNYIDGFLKAADLVSGL